MKYKTIPKKYSKKEGYILDIGGWAKPFRGATHVVDLFPWETRGYGLYLEELPGEMFSKDTWYQVDFEKKGMKLPFEDNEFEFSVCSQTLEDLVNPAPIIREMKRVSKSGYIETPNRLTEQTIGIKDAKSSYQGYSHHKWILEKDGQKVKIYNKSDSINSGIVDTGIPYRYWKSADKHEKEKMMFEWEKTLKRSLYLGKKQIGEPQSTKKILIQVREKCWWTIFGGRLGK
jgi:hypothetical protein